MQIFYDNLYHQSFCTAVAFLLLCPAQRLPHSASTWLWVGCCWTVVSHGDQPQHTHAHTHTGTFLCLAALACSIWSSTSTMTHHTHTHTYCIELPYFSSTGLLHLAKNVHSDQEPCIPTHCTQLLFALSDWLHSPWTHSHIVDNCMHSHTHDGEPLLSLPDLACSVLPCTFSDHSPHTHWLALWSFLSPVSGWLLFVVVQTWTGTSHMHSHTNYPELLSSSVPGRFGLLSSQWPQRHTAST